MTRLNGGFFNIYSWFHSLSSASNRLPIKQGRRLKAPHAKTPQGPPPGGRRLEVADCNEIQEGGRKARLRAKQEGATLRK